MSASAPQLPAKPHNRSLRFFRSVSALILREMATSYGRSPGGYIWAIAEPVGAIVMLTIAFSFILRTPSLGTNFPLFYATGFLPFMLYMAASNQMRSAIQYSKPLLSYPAVTFLDALLARLILTVLTQLLVFFILTGGIIWYWHLYLVLDIPAIFMSLAMAIALAIGVGSMNCYLATSFPIWGRAWGIVNRPLFLISGIFFLPEDIPAEYREYMMYNPLAHMISEMRKGFYGTYDAVYVDPLYVFSVSLVLAIFGMLFLLRNHKDVALK